MGTLDLRRPPRSDSIMVIREQGQEEGQKGQGKGWTSRQGQRSKGRHRSQSWSQEWELAIPPPFPGEQGEGEGKWCTSAAQSATGAIVRGIAETSDRAP